MCLSVFIPSPMREGSNVLGVLRGSIILNRAEISQEGKCGCQPEEILAQITLGSEKPTLNMGEFRLAQSIVSDSPPQSCWTTDPQSQLWME